MEILVNRKKRWHITQEELNNLLAGCHSRSGTKLQNAKYQAIYLGTKNEYLCCKWAVQLVKITEGERWQTIANNMMQT